MALLLDKLRNRWLARDEYESVPLRDWYAKRWNVEVGLYSYGCFDPWRVPARTRIGRYCSFAKTARVLDANHPTDALSTHPYFYERKWGVVTDDRIDPAWLVIEDDVWVSHNATIGPGCKHIGRGAIIGAHAFVARDVEPYAVMIGMPAKRARYRFDAETIAAIEASRWWTLDRAALAKAVAAAPGFAFRPDTASAADFLAAARR